MTYSKIYRPPHPIVEKFPTKWERLVYKTTNAITNSLWPVRPLHFTASTSSIAVYYYYFPNNYVLQILPKFENKYAEVAKICAFSTISAYIPILILRQLLKKLYFSYKGWIFENPKKPSLATKIWGVCQKILSFSPPLLKSCDSLLPSLPVPLLEDTVRRYLESVKHLHSEDEFEQIKLLSESFLKEEGRKLQTYAKIYSYFTDNYVTPFWEKYAYLYNRESVLINSSVAHTDQFGDRPSTWAHRAAHVTFIECQSHLAIDRELYKPLGNGLLCARHYDKMYAVTRVPQEDVDYLENYGISSHVVLLYNGNIYKVPICDSHNKMYTVEELTKVYADVLKRDDKPVEGPAGQIPALTADRRDVWARNRQKFFIDHPQNREVLWIIESAVVIICYDPSDEYGFDEGNPDVLSNFFVNMLTGKGYDRWADKTLNYAISKNTRCGGTTEHSTADGSEFDHLMENYIYNDTKVIEYPSLEVQREMEEINEKDRRSMIFAEKLEVTVSDEMSREITRCMDFHTKARSDVDLAAGVFTDFGKGLIKKCGVSPDAFVQMAIQLANYRDQGKFVLTYEAASARFFANSRTETLRTVSEESCQFVQLMEEKSATKSDKMAALRTACSSHGDRNRDCMVGKGVDRHLFVLLVISKAFNISSPFLNHYISQPWLLSTSHVPNCTNQVDEDKDRQDTWLGAVFAAVAKNGYGICYRFGGNHSILAHVTSYHSASNTDSQRFRSQLYRAFHDMADLFDVKN